MSKKVVIIGAGIAGLSAGCYARMNGYDVEIHESHTVPGGLCTAWQRGDYTVDGCLHWLTGSAPGAGLYGLWEELGAVQGRTMIDHEVFSSVVGCDGKTLHLYTDVDRLQAHLLDLAPQDARPIKALCSAIRRLSGFSMGYGKPPELQSRLDGLRGMASMLPYMRDLMAYDALTLSDLGARFSDPFLSDAIRHCMVDPSMPALALLMTLAPMSAREAGYPLGGSLPFARAIERRYLDLGGRIVYGSRVERVLEQDGRASGVRLAGGTEVGADWVVAACDMRTALYSLLDGGNGTVRMDPVHRELLECARLYDPAVLVSFGVDMDLSGDISCLGTAYELEEPVEMAGRTWHYLSVKNLCHDPSMAPATKSIVGSMLTTDWSFWEPLKDDRAAYRAEKERIAALCLAEIERHHPGVSARVEMTDVATPLTFERYTGNWKGTYMSWILSGDFRRKHPYIPKTVPGLDGFYLASMWTDAPGGLPGAASAGRGVVQLLCHADGRAFVTSKP